VLLIPVHGQVPLVAKAVVEGFGQVAADLHHPSLVRTWRRYRSTAIELMVVGVELPKMSFDRVFAPYGIALPDA
jgi:hypothetical protein